MDGRSAARLAYTAAAGHRYEERELQRRLSWFERRLVRLVFRRPNVWRLLEERGRAKAMRKWAWAVDDQCARDELVPAIRFDDVTPVVPMRRFLKG